MSLVASAHFPLLAQIGHAGQRQRMSAFGVKRTSVGHSEMSVTQSGHGKGLPRYRFEPLRCRVLSLEGDDEAA